MRISLAQFWKILFRPLGGIAAVGRLRCWSLVVRLRIQFALGQEIFRRADRARPPQAMVWAGPAARELCGSRPTSTRRAGGPRDKASKTVPSRRDPIMCGSRVSGLRWSASCFWVRCARLSLA
jgi:hypothetical protein